MPTFHLEEDTGTLAHRKDYSLVDFNRAGVPLMELVTKPCIESGFEARKFCEELQLILQYLEVSEANMEKGEMRCEVNISIREEGEKKFGTKVEIKNLNSFRAVEKSVEYEIERQKKVLEEGKRVIQETRGWDENKEVTFPQRLKESAHDYRYFPDPDLPALVIGEIPEFSEKTLRASLPELPWQKRERYKRDFRLKEGDIEIYVRQPEWGRLFEETAEKLKSSEVGKFESLVQLASNYITSDLKTIIPADALTEVIRMVMAGELSSRGAKDILKIIKPKKSSAEIFEMVKQGKVTQKEFEKIDKELFKNENHNNK